MKRYFGICRLLSLSLGLAFCWSCEKENVSTDFMVCMEQWEGANGQKVYINGVSPNFEMSDKIRINEGTYIITDFRDESSTTWGCLDWVSGVDAAQGPYYAAYPASAVDGTLANGSTNVTFTVPQAQRYQSVTIDGHEYQKLDAPMCAYTTDPNNTHLTFKNVCSVMDVKITNSTGDTRYIDAIEVIADNAQLSGTMTVSGFGTESPALVSGTFTEENNSVCLYGIGGSGGKRVSNGETAHFYIYLPTYSGATLTVKVHDNSHGSKFSSSKTQATSGTLPRNKMFAVAYTLTKADEHNEGFTPVTGGNGFTVQVDDYGNSVQRVYLGYGNLYHDATVSKQGKWYEEWFIAPFQFDLNAYVGNDEHVLTDLFYYSQGTSNNYGVNSSGTYAISSFKDWSEKVDSAGQGWRTLTGEEWYCLFFERANAANLFGYATITNIPTSGRSDSPYYTRTEQVGCIVLPDNWVMPASLQDHTFVTGDAGFSINEYDFEEWLLLEEAGAIFLPWQGLVGATDRVSYWATSYQGSKDVYNFCFHTKEIGGVHNHGTDPCFVRLAINVEAVDAPPSYIH